MSRRMRAYYYAVLGAAGGLLAWQASNLLGLSFTGLIYLSDAPGGARSGSGVGGRVGAGAARRGRARWAACGEAWSEARCWKPPAAGWAIPPSAKPPAWYCW